MTSFNKTWEVQMTGFSEFMHKKPLIAQEFWVFIASGIALASFVLVWASIIIACKLLIKLVKANQKLGHDIESFGVPMERPSSMMVQPCTRYEKDPMSTPKCQHSPPPPRYEEVVVEEELVQEESPPDFDSLRN